MVIGSFGEDSNATGVNGNQSDNSAAGSGAAYVFTGLGPSPPPQLSIELFVNGLRLFWPTSATDYVLEQSSALQETALWSQTLLPRETDATRQFITVPSPGENMFYRLRKP